MEVYFLKPDDVAKILRISYPKAAVIIRELNQELKEQKKMIQRGRIVKSYFCERYGINEEIVNASL